MRSWAVARVLGTSIIALAGILGTQSAPAFDVIRGGNDARDQEQELLREARAAGFTGMPKWNLHSGNVEAIKFLRYAVNVYKEEREELHAKAPAWQRCFGERMLDTPIVNASASEIRRLGDSLSRSENRDRFKRIAYSTGGEATREILLAVDMTGRSNRIMLETKQWDRVVQQAVRSFDDSLLSVGNELDFFGSRGGTTTDGGTGSEELPGKVTLFTYSALCEELSKARMAKVIEFSRLMMD